YNPDWSVNDDEVCANAILQYLDTHLPKDNQHKIYMDQGTEGLDALYLRYEDQAREIARNNGYTEENGRLKVYDADGAGHNEIFWQARLHIPLSFILTKEAPGNSGIDDLLPDPTIGPCDNSIYDISGRKYRSEDLDNLPAGIYIQYGKKIIKR
ncbi:MAG: T9SS type A sorting domain-containing protein, partial [Muribaculaceae bacterium]|nr:T9SS type A sorting domain-containing protein [Muribaculaceae bacterium]